VTASSWTRCSKSSNWCFVSQTLSPALCPMYSCVPRAATSSLIETPVSASCLSGSEALMLSLTGTLAHLSAICAGSQVLTTDLIYLSTTPNLRPPLLLSIQCFHCLVRLIDINLLLTCIISTLNSRINSRICHAMVSNPSALQYDLAVCWQCATITINLYIQTRGNVILTEYLLTLESHRNLT
jgi:hypothetical protein